MQYDFLRQFQMRMKKVGAYAVLFKNSLAKTTWKRKVYLGEHKNKNGSQNKSSSCFKYMQEQNGIWGEIKKNAN